MDIVCTGHNNRICGSETADYIGVARKSGRGYKCTLRASICVGLRSAIRRIMHKDALKFHAFPDEKKLILFWEGFSSFDSLNPLTQSSLVRQTLKMTLQL